MIIPITFSPDSSTSNSKLPSTLAKISHDEIVLIELQGSLDAGEGAPPSERNGKFVGKLSIDDELVSALQTMNKGSPGICYDHGYSIPFRPMNLLGMREWKAQKMGTDPHV